MSIRYSMHTGNTECVWDIAKQTANWKSWIGCTDSVLHGVLIIMLWTLWIDQHDSNTDIQRYKTQQLLGGYQQLRNKCMCFIDKLNIVKYKKIIFWISMCKIWMFFFDTIGHNSSHTHSTPSLLHNNVYHTLQARLFRLD